jgi:fucose permease
MASILAGATVVGRLLAGITLRYISWFRLLLFCIISAAALVLVVMPLANFTATATATDTVTSWSQAPLVAYIFPLIGLFLAPIYPIINSTILSALPRKKHPQMSGLIVVFSALGGTTGSIITGTLFENYDGVTAFYFSLVPMVLIVFTLLYFKKMVAHYE